MTFWSTTKPIPKTSPKVLQRRLEKEKKEKKFYKDIDQIVNWDIVLNNKQIDKLLKIVNEFYWTSHSLTDTYKNLRNGGGDRKIISFYYESWRELLVVTNDGISNLPISIGRFNQMFWKIPRK